MDKQVLSIDQMNHLKELGLNLNKAHVYWIRIVRPITHINEKEAVIIDWTLSLNKEVMHTPLDVVEIIPTFTLQDIFDLLPTSIECSGKKYSIGTDIIVDVMCIGDKWLIIEYKSLVNGDIIKRSANDIFIDAAYEMLCWCIENGYVV